MLKKYSDANHIVEEVLQRVGTKIVVGTPLGIGKANRFLNSLYRRAREDTSINLQILTGLTLQRPVGKSDIEQRFIDLFQQRLFGNYPDLEFELDRVKGVLPKNIEVIEFFFAPAKFLNSPRSQRHYISSNYTHAARDMFGRGVNVMAQLVSPGDRRLSLSSNPDVSLDLVPMMRRRAKESGKPIAVIGELNSNLPYMYGDCEVGSEFFDFLLDDPKSDFPLFGTPKESLSDQDYLIGLYTSTLIKDGGELQIGIGALGDAIVYFLNLRHLRASTYHETLNQFSVPTHFGKILSEKGSIEPFREGLYCATEMVVDGFLHLLEAGILKREVFDDLAIQRLLNQGLISTKVTSNMVLLLQMNGAVSNPLSVKDIKYLKKFGILNQCAPECDGLQWEDFLGESLKGGIIIHGGFFLGPSSFYEGLRNMPQALRQKINMTSVCRINQLYGHEELDRLHRKSARFVNTTLMVTLSGAAVSDGIEGNRVLSGVGGQYNFVAMAHELPDGHSILCFRSTRTSQGRVYSNVVWEYPHVTIPRHLRDVFVNEYGIADLRGKTDEEIIQALLNITDSRFQDELMMTAKRAGKLRSDYTIPSAFKNNLPSQISEKFDRLRQQFSDFAPLFPFGSEFTKDELRLGKALKKLKNLKEDKKALILKIVKSFFRPVTSNEEHERLIAMMRLNHPQTFNEKTVAFLLRRLLCE